MKKILLTGSFGFLGNYFIDHLKKKYSIYTLDRNDGATISCDISKPLLSISDKFDLIIHAAGKAHSIPKTDQEIKSFFDINFEGTVNLCNALEENIPNTFVFISTIAVYGLDEGSDIKEIESLNGSTPYAKSKIMAERYLQDWAREKKINLVILRLPLVAGKDPKGNLGAMIHGIKKGYYFNISGSKALKSIILADDVAKLIPELMGKNGIYNLSGDKDYTFQEISKIIAKQLNAKKTKNLPTSIVNILAKIGDFIPVFPINSLKLKKITSNLTVSSEKAIQELNWQPQSLDENFRIE